MIHHGRTTAPHPLVVPVPRVLVRTRRLARALALRKLRSWRHGHLHLDLPDGDATALGDPTAASRARVTVHDDRLFVRLIARGEMGAGESYVAGEWDADDLVGALRLFVRNLSHVRTESPLTVAARIPDLVRHRLRSNTRSNSRRNIHAHYDLGNDFYRLFLDETMTYSCAIYERPDQPLAGAQRAKLDRLLDAAGVRPGDHLLDIGGGWGGMAIHAARTRGCRVTAITVSHAQRELAARRVADAGLASQIDVRLVDYRDLTGRFDAIVSVEMLEAVGYEHLDGFFSRCAELLAPGGRLAIQTITMPDDRFDAYRRSVDWTQTYIFPGCLIPSPGALRASTRRAGLQLIDRAEIGAHYATTLRAWRRAFEARLAEVRALGFDEPFIRTWRMYLAFSEAAFAERSLGNAQLVYRAGGPLTTRTTA